MQSLPVLPPAQLSVGHHDHSRLGASQSIYVYHIFFCRCTHVHLLQSPTDDRVILQCKSSQPTFSTLGVLSLFVSSTSIWILVWPIPLTRMSSIMIALSGIVKPNSLLYLGRENTYQIVISFPKKKKKISHSNTPKTNMCLELEYNRVEIHAI